MSHADDYEFSLVRKGSIRRMFLKAKDKLRHQTLRGRRASPFSTVVFNTGNPAGPEKFEEDSISSADSSTRMSFTSVRRWAKTTSPIKTPSPLRNGHKALELVSPVTTSERTPPPSIHLDLQPTLFFDAQLREAVGLDQEDFNAATSALPESATPGDVLKEPHRVYMPSRSTTEHWRTRPATESFPNQERMPAKFSGLNVEEESIDHLRLHLDTSTIDMSVGTSQLPSPVKTIELPFRPKQASDSIEAPDEYASPLQTQELFTRDSDKEDDGAYELEINDMVEKATRSGDGTSDIQRQSHGSSHAIEDLRRMRTHRERAYRSSLTFASSRDHKRILERIKLEREAVDTVFPDEQITEEQLPQHDSGSMLTRIRTTCQVCGGTADHNCDVISPSKLSTSSWPLKERKAADAGNHAIMQTLVHQRTGSQDSGMSLRSSKLLDQADLIMLQRKKSDPVGLGLTTEWLQSLSPTGARCRKGSRRCRRDSGSWMSNRRSSQEVNEDMMAGRAKIGTDSYSIDEEESTGGWVKVPNRL